MYKFHNGSISGLHSNTWNFELFFTFSNMAAFSLAANRRDINSLCDGSERNTWNHRRCRLLQSLWLCQSHWDSAGWICTNFFFSKRKLWYCWWFRNQERKHQCCIAKNPDVDFRISGTKDKLPSSFGALLISEPSTASIANDRDAMSPHHANKIAS